MLKKKKKQFTTWLLLIIVSKDVQLSAKIKTSAEVAWGYSLMPPTLRRKGKHTTTFPLISQDSQVTSIVYLDKCYSVFAFNKVWHESIDSMDLLQI